MTPVREGVLAHLEALGKEISRTVDEAGELERLRNIASRGRRLFDLVVRTADQAGFLADLPPTDSGRRSLVIAHAESVRIPWSLLYTRDALPASLTDVEGFLGARHLILNLPYVNEVSMATDTDGDRIGKAQTSGTEAVGHIWDSAFLAETGQPLNLRWRAAVTGWTVESLRELRPDAETAQAMTAALTSFVQTSRDVLHFDCHGEKDPESERDESQPDIFVRNRFPVPHDTVTTWGFAANPTILIGLNVCRAAFGRVGEHDEGSVAENFLANGAGACVGPTTLVVYDLAMEFSSGFYRRLDRGESYLDAFEAVQRDIIVRDAGVLVYSLFGAPGFVGGGLKTPAVSRLVQPLGEI